MEYYHGKEITIVFDRYLCMGAGYCGELEAVFGTHDAPKYESDVLLPDADHFTLCRCGGSKKNRSAMDHIRRKA